MTEPVVFGFSLLDLMIYPALFWVMTGALFWAPSNIMMSVLNIQTVYGHKLNFLDCCWKGPVTAALSMNAIFCPEYTDQTENGSDQKGES